ncbi:MAG: hypothetical protein KGY39_09235 [Anaerolineales bacterium]|nr:hypothetical protein [Anaerolineales bacterium]
MRKNKPFEKGGLLAVLLFMAACGPESTSPTATLSMVPVTQSRTPAPTAAAQSKPLSPTVEPTAPDGPPWKRVQCALASAFLSPPGQKSRGICEWQNLGKSDAELYLWAMCQAAGEPEGPAVSAPAVIRLDQSGRIVGVDIPRDGELYGPDVRELFPSAIQEVIFNHNVDTDAMWAHIQKRHKTPQPPLVVQGKTPSP